jgi:hypothetical protein
MRHGYNVITLVGQLGMTVVMCVATAPLDSLHLRLAMQTRDGAVSQLT